jgi:hypothetical protein
MVMAVRAFQPWLLIIVQQNDCLMRDFNKKLFFVLLCMVLSAGKLLAQAAPTIPPADGEYRSNGAVNLTSTTNWEMAAGGTWSASASIPDGSKTITIQNGNAFTVDAPLNVTGYLKFGTGLTPITTSVNASATSSSTAVTLTAANASIANGQLIVGAGLGANASVANIAGTALTLSVASSIPISSTLTFYTAPVAPTLTIGGGSITIASGGTYEHCVDGGTIPTATWSVGSTCKVTGVISPGGTPAITGITTGTTTGSTFHHLVFNCPYMASNATFTFALANPTANTSVIGGDFTVVSTGPGSGAIRLWGASNGVNRSFTVNGNFSMQAGILTSTGSGGPFTSPTTVTVNIGGKMYVTGGTVNCSSSGASGLFVVWNLNGDFQIDGGTFAIGNATPSSIINLNKAGTQLFTRNGGTLTQLPLVVKPGSTVELAGTSGLIDGANAFTLSTGATLKTSHVGGVNGAITTTGYKSFSSGASYIFSGVGAQVTSSFAGRHYVRSGTITGSPTVILSQYNANIATGNTISGTGIPASTTILTAGAAVSIAAISGTATSSSTALSVVDATGILAGMTIATTAGVPLGYVSAVSGNNLTLSANATVAAATPLTITGQSVTISQNATSTAATNTLSIVLNPVSTASNLTISNAAGVTLSSPLTVTGAVSFGSVNNAIFTTGGNLTLGSSASGTGRIADITNAGANSGNAISGNVTVQRFIAGGAAVGTPGRRGFRFLSHPFNSNPLLSSLIAGGLSITGTGGASNGFTNNPNAGATNNPSAYSYDPAQVNAGSTSTVGSGATNDPGWIAYTNANAQTWNKLQGIRALFRGTGTQGLDGVASYNLSDLTLSMTGAVNTGTQTFTLPATPDAITRWSLVGNPYPSQINIQALLFTKYAAGAGNIGASAYVFNPNKTGTGRGGYDMVDITTNGGGTPYVLPSNAVVLVQNTVATSHDIAFAETDKNTGVANLGFRTQGANNALVLSLEDGNGMELDKTYIRFNQAAKTKFDNHDGTKMVNEYGIYTTATDKTMLAIDSRPEPTTETIIPLGIQSSTAKSFVLKISELDLPIGVTAYLKDNFLHVQDAITGTSFIYSFSTTSNTASSGAERFELVFNKTVVPMVLVTEFAVALSPNPAKDKVKVSFSNEQAANTTISITNAEGKLMKTVDAGHVQAGQLSINIKSLAKGTYYVTLSNGKERRTEKLQVQ